MLVEHTFYQGNFLKIVQESFFLARQHYVIASLGESLFLAHSQQYVSITQHYITDLSYDILG